MKWASSFFHRNLKQKEREKYRMNKEKMIVVEKKHQVEAISSRSGFFSGRLAWWLYIRFFDSKSTNQQSTVQTSKTQQDNQDGNNMQSHGGQPPQGNNNQEGGSNSKKKPANADGSTKAKDINSNQNNEENTTKS